MPVDEIHGSHGLFKCATLIHECGQQVTHSAVVIFECRHIVAYDMKHPEDERRPPDMLRQVTVTGVQYRDDLLQIDILPDVLFGKRFSLNEIKHQNAGHMVHDGRRQSDFCSSMACLQLVEAHHTM